MLAIAIEESSLNPSKINYNCRYKKTTENNGTFDKLTGNWLSLDNVSSSKTSITGYVSTWCRQGQEKFAWSKDGGVFQINNPTANDFNVDNNIISAKAKLSTQGLKAWTAYTTGRYKDNLIEAKKLLAQI